MSTKQIIQYEILKLEEQLKDARQKLAEFQEPDMAQDTLCEVWDNIWGVGHEKLRYYSHEEDNKHYFFAEGATSKTSERTMDWSYFKIIEEPGLSWKSIDDNIPKGCKYLYLVRENSNYFILCDLRHVMQFKFTGQYVVVKR